MLNLLKFLWPLIKELVLGEKSFKDALSTNKLRVFLLVLIFASFITNFFAVPRLVSMSKEHLELVTKYDALTKGPTPPAVRVPVGTVPHKVPEVTPVVVTQTQERPPAPTNPLPDVVIPPHDKAKPVVKTGKQKTPDSELTPEQRYKRLQERFNRMKQLEDNSLD